MILIITGTDTEVGKTITTAALTVRAGAAGVERGDQAVAVEQSAQGGVAGRSVAVVKPAQTGVAADELGDLAEVERLTGLTDLHEGVRLRDPLAPTTAARREGIALPSVEAHAKMVDDLARTRDTVLVEGAGGLLVGLDADGNNLADLARHLTTPFAFVVVARAGLGTLNHTGLTVEALRAGGLPIQGLVVGSWPAEPDLAEQCNVEDLPATTGVPVIGRIPAGAGQLSREEFTRAAPGWFA